ncbi:MAG: LPS export ABC transporter periplasmic protein LptC [Halothiobacillaceae bacterium]
MPTSKTLLWPALLLLVVLTGWWNLREGQDSSQPTELPRVDHSLIGFRATGFDETGRPTWQLAGAQVDHLQAEQAYEMTQVQVDYYGDAPERRVPWHLQAPAGKADDRLTRITLFGGVTADREAAPPMQALAFATEHLVLEPKQGLARTQAPVTMSEQAVWTSRSRGLRLDREAETLLQPAVRDRYLPPADKQPADAEVRIPGED